VSGHDDRRFRRSQVKSARRKGRRPAVPWAPIRTVIGLVSGAAALAVAVHLTVASTVFVVERITIRGHARLSRGEVLLLLDGLRQQPILQVDLDEWRRRLLGSSWVADARLRRRLPSTVDVAIVERVPLAVARLDGQLFLVDAGGAVIDDFGPRYADIDLPIIDGLSRTEAADPSSSVRAALVARALGSLSRRRDLLNRVSQIDVHDPRNAIVILDDERTRVQLGDSNFAERLHSYLELAPALQSRVPDIDYVDLRYEPRVFVRPQKGGRVR
jgi:cell division protein FtsQ